MRKLKVLISSLIMVLAIISVASAQKSASGYALNSQIPMNPAVKKGVLDNGLTYFIMNNKKPENRAELQLVVMAGSLQEDDDQNGLAHFIEHMCFNGTKNFPKNDLIKFLEATGVRFGADINANTAYDRTYYMLTIPLDKDGLLDKGLLVLEDWLSNVSFDPEEIDKERGVVIEEYRVRNNAQTRTFRQHMPYLGFGTKYPARDIIGDTTILRNAPREAFVRYYKDWYRPNLSALIAVGDFDVDMMEKKIIQNFSDVKNPSKPRVREENTFPIHKDTKVSVAVDPENQFSSIQMIYKHPERQRGTYGEYKENLMDGVFTNVFTERMQEYARKPDGKLLFGMASHSRFPLGNVNATTIICVPKKESVLQGYEEFLIEAFRAFRNGVTNSEFARAKSQMLASMESALNEKDKTESAGFARELFRHFYEGESVPGIELENQMTKDFLNAITVEELNQYYKNYITEEGLVIMASFSGKDEVVPTKEELLAVYNKVKKMEIAAMEEDDLDKPLMAKIPTPGTIKSSKEIKDMGVKEYKLSNGATVMAKKTDFKNDQIMMRAFSNGGTSVVSDTDFNSANLTSSIIGESGIGEFNQSTLEKMLSGKQVSVSPAIGELTEGFIGGCVPRDTETMFQLLHLYFTQPRKDQDAYKSFVSRMGEFIRNSQSNPSSVFNDSISAIMGSYHKRALPMTEATLKDIDLSKSFEFYKQRFSDASDFTFFFVGNYDEAELENLIKTYIASLPSSGKADKWKDVGIKAPKGSFRKSIYKGIEPKTSVRLIINGDLEYNRKNIHALTSMMEILSVRLREVIREDLGGVYGIGAFPQITQYPKPGYKINIVFGTSVERTEELITEIKRVITEFKAGKFEESYVANAKEIMKREHEIRLKENSYWMNVLYNYTFNNENFDYVVNYQKYVDSITLADVKSAANKYLDMSQWKEFILYPED